MAPEQLAIVAVIAVVLLAAVFLFMVKAKPYSQPKKREADESGEVGECSCFYFALLCFYFALLCSS